MAEAVACSTCGGFVEDICRCSKDEEDEVKNGPRGDREVMEGTVAF